MFLAAAAANSIFVPALAASPQSVPVRFVDGLPMINVTLGSIGAEYVLDTGGQIGITVAPPLIVPTAGVSLNNKFIKMGDAAGNVFEVQSLTASDVKVGATSLGTVQGLRHYQWGLSIGEDKKAPQRNNGVIGLGALSVKNLLFDLGNDRLVLFEQPTEYPDLSAWLKLPFRYDREGITIEMGVGDTRAAMVLDTGATLSVMSRDSAAFAGRSPCRNVPANAGFCGIVPLKTLRLHGQAIPDIPVAVVAMAGVSFDGILGVDFFRRYRILVDFNQGVLYLKSNKR